MQVCNKTDKPENGNKSPQKGKTQEGYGQASTSKQASKPYNDEKWTYCNLRGHSIGTCKFEKKKAEQFSVPCDNCGNKCHETGNCPKPKYAKKTTK